ncbi:hypothetical protein U1Q18_028208 [Sarracenia purpurea var. burkii]
MHAATYRSMSGHCRRKSPARAAQASRGKEGRREARSSGDQPRLAATRTSARRGDGKPMRGARWPGAAKKQRRRRGEAGGSRCGGKAGGSCGCCEFQTGIRVWLKGVFS